MEVRTNEELIDRTPYECELLRVRNGVPRRKREGMLSELEQHLREADRDGKPVEAVVGEAVKAFAESWAEENRPPRELGKRLLILAEYVAASVAVFAALAHPWQRALSFDVDLWSILPVWLLVFSLASATNLFPALATIEHLKPRWKRNLAILVVASATVSVPAAIAALALGSRDATLFEWSWPTTLVSLLIALLVYGLRRRLIPDVRAFIRRRVR